MKKNKQPRNFHAVNAHFRSSAGPMKDRKKEINKNYCRNISDDIIESEELSEDTNKVLMENTWELYQETTGTKE